MQHQDFHIIISILNYFCLYLFNFNKAMNNELSSPKYCTQAECFIRNDRVIKELFII